jgi:hypothetical protein
MDPDEFLATGPPIDIADELTAENIQDLLAHVESGRTLDPLVIYDDKGLARSMDGRHRAHLAKQMGLDSVPVVDFRQRRATLPGEPSRLERARAQEADPEAYLGRGVYMSSSPEDVAANYARIDAPDITNKIERVKDQIYDSDEALDIAHDLLGAEEVERILEEGGEEALIDALARESVTRGDAPRSMRMFAKDDGIVDISPDSPTFIEGKFYPDPADYLDEAGGDWGAAEELAEAAWDDFEESGPLVDIIKSLQEAGPAYGFEPDELVSKIAEASADGGIRADELWDIFKNDEQLSYAYSDMGESYSSEVARQAFEDAGFRGIEMDAHVAFPKMDIRPGTRHRAMFDPADARVEFAQFDPANIGSSKLLGKADPRILAPLAGGAVAATAAQDAEAGPMGALAKAAGIPTRRAHH